MFFYSCHFQIKNLGLHFVSTFLIFPSQVYFPDFFCSCWWTGAICRFILPYCEKLYSRTLDLNYLFPSWTNKTCRLKSPLIEKLFSQMWMAFFLHALHCCNMLFQVTLSRTTVFTNFTFEWLNSFMNWCNMSIQVVL